MFTNKDTLVNAIRTTIIIDNLIVEERNNGYSSSLWNSDYNAVNRNHYIDVNETKMTFN